MIKRDLSWGDMRWSTIGKEYENGYDVKSNAQSYINLIIKDYNLGRSLLCH